MSGWEPIPAEILEASKRMKETNDCTVLAWSVAFDAPYERSHAWLRKHGRRNGRGMLPSAFLKAFQACKIVKVKVGPYTKENRITVAKFCKDHPKGRYLVHNVNHAFVINDGVVIDFNHGPRRQITAAVRIYLEGELNASQNA